MENNKNWDEINELGKNKPHKEKIIKPTKPKATSLGRNKIIHWVQKKFILGMHGWFNIHKTTILRK